MEYQEKEIFEINLNYLIMKNIICFFSLLIFPYVCIGQTYLECNVSGTYDWFGANGKSDFKKLNTSKVTVEISNIGKDLNIQVDGPDDYLISAFSLNLPNVKKYGQNLSTDQVYEVLSRNDSSTSDIKQQIRINRVSGLLTASKSSLLKSTGGRIDISISGQCQKLENKNKF